MGSAPSGAVAGAQSGGADFADVLAGWRELAPHATYFFQTYDWIELVPEHIAGEVRWAAEVVDGHPVAASVLVRSVRRAGGIPLRMLTRARLKDTQLLYTDCLLDPAAAGGDALARLIERSGPWDVLWLVGLRAGSPWLALADRALVQDEPRNGAGVIETRAPFEERWRAVPANMRNAVRKARRKIGEAGDCEVVVATGADLPAAFERFLELEASGWKGRAGSALASRPADAALWLRYLERAPDAQIRLLDIGGRPAAAQITLITARTMFLPKIAYDEELARFAPSNVLMAALIEACCEDPAVDRIDCLMWQPWHPRWGMTREPTYSLVAFNRRSVRGNAARAGRAAWALLHRGAVLGTRERPSRRGTQHVEA
jgi:CelD/BcsL family acetyltransferase involved in cellulose biosynthesis